MNYRACNAEDYHAYFLEIPKSLFLRYKAHCIKMPERVVRHRLLKLIEMDLRINEFIEKKSVEELSDIVVAKKRAANKRVARMKKVRGLYGAQEKS